jgi:chromosome segregation ATPase
MVQELLCIGRRGRLKRILKVEMNMDDKSLRSKIAGLQNTGACPESGSADGARPSDVESHFARLSNLLNKLRSISDRTGAVKSRVSGRSDDFELFASAALKEAECADLIEESLETELTSLLSELKQKHEALQAREMALSTFEEAVKAKVAELQSRVRRQETELTDRETERQQLTTERDRLVNRLHEAELTAKHAAAEARQFKERLESEFSALKLNVVKREESVAAMKSDLRGEEGDQKTDIENLQLRLQNTEEKLASQERELKEKEIGIQAAAVREAEMGKLIDRLSSECEKLSADLCEKGLIISRLEDTAPFFSGGKAWQKVLRLMQGSRVLRRQ